MPFLHKMIKQFQLQLLILSSIFLISFTPIIYGDVEGDEHGVEPPNLGNFALPSSQQPGSLLSFGQNIFDKGNCQFNLGSIYMRGPGQHSLDVFPNLIYAPSDNASVLLLVPYAPQYKEGKSRSSGIEDVRLQYEFAFYTDKSACFTDLATVIMNISAPTGSISKQPPTGFGAPTYFLGSAFLRTYVDWILFFTHGALITSTHHRTKFGNQFFYQYGVGKNIGYVKDTWIFNWALELTGQYTKKDRINGMIDPNSGGNVVFLTPSLWFSTNHLILQFGIGKPVIQHLFGSQKKTQYMLLGNFAWTF